MKKMSKKEGMKAPGYLITKVRELIGISTNAFAPVLGMTPGALYKLEDKGQYMEPELFLKAYRASGLSADKFMELVAEAVKKHPSEPASVEESKLIKKLKDRISKL